MKFETKLNKLGIDENEVKSIIMNCECGEINGAYLIDLTKEKKEFIMEVIGNYLDDDSEEFEGWTDIKRIATFCKVFDITEDEIADYYRLGFNEGGCDIAYNLESNKDVILVLTDDERYSNSFIQYSPSQKAETEKDEESSEPATYLVHKKYNEKAHDNLITSKEALAILKEKAGLDYTIKRVHRYGKEGEILGYNFTDKDGNTFYKKSVTGTDLIDTLCEYADCKLIRVSEEGVRESKLVGWLVVDANKEMLGKSQPAPADTEFEPYTVDFKIQSNKNPSVYIEGKVDINDEEAEDCDWWYWNGTQYQPNAKIHHDDVLISGATYEQENEIEQFRSDWMDDDLWLTDAILQSDEDEYCTYVRENITLIIEEMEA